VSPRLLALRFITGFHSQPDPMKIYVVWFPRIGGFAGKRGRVEESAERAVMFWQFAEAKEWADVLGERCNRMRKR